MPGPVAAWGCGATLTFMARGFCLVTSVSHKDSGFVEPVDSEDGDGNVAMDSDSCPGAARAIAKAFPLLSAANFWEHAARAWVFLKFKHEHG